VGLPKSRSTEAQVYLISITTLHDRLIRKLVLAHDELPFFQGWSKPGGMGQSPRSAQNLTSREFPSHGCNNDLSLKARTKKIEELSTKHHCFDAAE
jgi:hypothetical protein